VRVDRETKSKLNATERASLKTYLENHLHEFDGVIVEDYGKGLLDQALATEIIEACKKEKKILTIDPNPHNPLDWSGATAIKPNRIEALTSAGIAPRDDEEALREAAQILMKRWKSDYLLITLGDEGMELFQNGKPSYHTPTRAKEVYDVTGAGDTVIALFTLALASGAAAIDAAKIANHAAGIVVGKLGTATLSPAELLQSFSETSP
ncbi:MAG: PfkB family carbohydrate kinase, partial [Verrucomicrobiota bacterium]